MGQMMTRLRVGWEWRLFSSGDHWSLRRQLSRASNDKQEAAMGLWGQSISVRGQRKCSGPHVGTAGSAPRDRKKASWLETWVWEMISGLSAQVTSNRTSSLWRTVRILFFKKPNSLLKVSVWGEKHTLGNNTFCGSLTKSNCHQVHGPGLQRAVARNHQTGCLFTIWSERHAEFYEHLRLPPTLLRNCWVLFIEGWAIYKN